MNKYIGFKMIQAEPETRDGAEGYKVVYPDGYESWSPKVVFEKAYMQIGDNNTITQKNVDEFIKQLAIQTVGDKTTVVTATLSNGFVIVEASSCVDSANYSEDIGAEICIEKIKDKVWAYLGFLLQTAKDGVSGQ